MIGLRNLLRVHLILINFFFKLEKPFKSIWKKTLFFFSPYHCEAFSCIGYPVGKNQSAFALVEKFLQNWLNAPFKNVILRAFLVKNSTEIKSFIVESYSVLLNILLNGNAQLIIIYLIKAAKLVLGSYWSKSTINPNAIAVVLAILL